MIVSFAVAFDGVTREGFHGDELFRRTAAIPEVDAAGFNCVSGPHHLLEYIRGLDLSILGGKALSVMPNAGYPTALGRRTAYQGAPDYFGEKLAQITQAGAAIVGGCCGTTDGAGDGPPPPPHLPGPEPECHQGPAAGAVHGGVHNVLLVTGDPIPSQDRDAVESVHNFNSRKLARRTLKGKILGGIYPVVSYKNACFLHNEIAGMRICPEIIALYQDKDREAAEDLAVTISTRIAKEIAPCTDGLYLMTPLRRVTLMTRILERLPR